MYTYYGDPHRSRLSHYSTEDHIKMYVTDYQLGDRYSVHRSTIWRWVRNGYIPPPRSITPGTTRWKLETIERFEAQREKNQTARSA